MAPSSSGKDTGLSRQVHGFESRRGYLITIAVFGPFAKSEWDSIPTAMVNNPGTDKG